MSIMSAGPTRRAIPGGYAGRYRLRSNPEFTPHVTPCLVGITSALLLLQQRLLKAVQQTRSIWTLPARPVVASGVGCGLFAGCVASASDHAPGPVYTSQTQ